ncbi:unnamed protein product [Caenorhabditis brenneri]
MEQPTVEDEPQVCRNDIIAMLSASGYHRARVVKLNDYDKIVGGIAWAITRCDDVAVAANLLYEESEDQNIKLRTEQSEKIIEALVSVGCPHQISAHQLFGLDFVALKNVVQWLLRRILAPQNENRFKHFTDWFSQVDRNSNDDVAIKEYRRRLKGRRVNQRTMTRYMKRFDTTIIFDLSLDAKCTLAEYVVYSRSGEIEEKPEAAEDAKKEEDGKDNLQEASSKKHVPTSTVREMMDKATVENLFKPDTPEVAESRKKICEMIDEFNVAKKLAKLEDRLVAEATEFFTAKKEHEELAEKFKRMMDKVNSEEEIDREQLKEIFDSFKSAEKRAAELREHCVKDLKKAQEHQNRLRLNVDEHGKVQAYCPFKREAMEKHAEKVKEIGKSVREAISIQFRLDKYMCNALKSHYRRRNMERIQDSSDLTHEAKSAVIDFNVTVDILTFSTKINQFINEVEKTLLAQPATQEYRDAFVAYMNDVRNQLGEYHWKAKITQDKSKTEKESLAKFRAEIRAKEREVLFTTGELKKLLDVNRLLQKQIAHIAVMEKASENFEKERVEKLMTTSIERMNIPLE